MPNLHLTNVRLLKFERNGNEASASFESALSKSVIKSMDWAEIVCDRYKQIDLDGKLHATNFELIPVESELKRHAIDLKVSETAHFKAIRLENEGKRQKGFRWVLRFRVTISDLNGCAKLEGYQATVGLVEAKASITYEKQTELDIQGSDEDEEDAQGELVGVGASEEGGD